MEILVGDTGFVGGNIAVCHKFDMLCNSKNISSAYGVEPELLVYAGVPAEMFLANKDPNEDKAITENAAANIHKINPKRLVLISTIAVLDNPVSVDEDTPIDGNNLTAYGLNRLSLERLAADSVADCHIIRLPALFGKGIKKNFIYDMINFFPTLLTETRYAELSSQESLIAESYAPQGNGFYKLVTVDSKRAELRSAFERVGFSALNFTDSRSVFQFYNLGYLWHHIETATKHGIPLLHTATEPLSAGEVYKYVCGKLFKNELAKPPLEYDYRTKYVGIFGGANSYIFGRERVLTEIKDFVEGSKRE
ncbi:MAG: sugar nucleotide-binding protein [Clostridiales bacterium]|jgi:nucleoside-diphosphate-sugar epimerase|nr:sugar nucleotide-binding protein [Clostridiales bacterium]